MDRQARGHTPAFLTLFGLLFFALVVFPQLVHAGGLATFELKLLPAELEANDGFGGDVAVHGDTIVIGARYDDDGGVDAGAAYVYRRIAGSWVFDGKLVALDAQAGDEFGAAVAVHDDFIVVGAPFVDAGDQNTGAAYAFSRVGGAWSEDQKLFGTVPNPSDFFGWAVDISGDPPVDNPSDDDIFTIAVGAPNDRVGGGVAERHGSVTLFQLSGDGSSWDFKAYLTADAFMPPDAGDNDKFGTSVAIAADLVVVGAPEEDGEPACGCPQSGSAYRFARTNIIGSWVPADKIRANDPATSDFFGANVDISFDFVTNLSQTLVGARRNDDAGTDTGSAYIFQQGIQEKLLPDDAASGYRFGRSVAVDRNRLVIGADGVDSDRGAAYLFNRPQAFGDWTQADRFQASDGDIYDLFGRSVAIDGVVVVVGAPDDEQAAVGAGVAYIYEFPLFIDGFESGDTSAWTATVP